MTTKELLALASDWRRAAHQLRGDCEPMPASAMRLDECADELEAALPAMCAEVEALRLEAGWKWFGLPAHFIGAKDCMFRMATQVGDVIVSTVGDYRPTGNDGKRTAIGCDRDYETYVFRVGEGACLCGCGLPNFDASEIDAEAANDAKTAADNHMAMCRKYAAIDAAKEPK